MATHHFKPTRYHITLGSHEPVLRIADGDTVVTTTVDAGGYDSRGESSGPHGNAQTGPFYLEGAETGDTLALRLDHLYPNRDSGWAGNVVAPNVVDPSYARLLPDGGERAEWKIDRVLGTAT